MTENSSVPATPAANPLSKDWTWVTHHLAALAITGALVVGGVYGVETLVEKHDLQNSDKWTQILNQQQAQTKTLQQQIAADETVNAARDAAYQKSIAQLASSIAQRNANEQKQQQQDATLDAQQAAQRLVVDTQAKPGEITVAGDTIGIDLPVARNIIGGFDLLVAAQANLQDTQNQLKAETGIATDALTDDAAQKKLVLAQQQTLTDTQKDDNAKLAVCKADARKGKLKWFGIGYVAGFISGATAHLW